MGAKGRFGYAQRKDEDQEVGRDDCWGERRTPKRSRGWSPSHRKGWCDYDLNWYSERNRLPYTRLHSQGHDP